MFYSRVIDVVLINTSQPGKRANTTDVILSDNKTWRQYHGKLKPRQSTVVA